MDKGSGAIQQLNHDPKKWSAFECRYFEELKGNTAVAELNKRLKEHRKLTLLYFTQLQTKNTIMPSS